MIETPNLKPVPCELSYFEAYLRERILSGEHGTA